MPKTRDRLTYKEKQFVKNFTDSKNSETFLNATQSALSSYDANYKSASKIGSEKLGKPYIQDAIAKRISTKEQDMESLTKLTDKIEDLIAKNTFTEENAVFFKALSSELRENHKLKGQFRGDFIEKSVNINVNANMQAENSSKMGTEDLIKALTHR